MLPDNAHLHTANLTREKLMEMHWTTLERLSESPDLSHCNYHIFEFLKEILGSKRFGDDIVVETNVCYCLETHPSFYYDGIKEK